MNIYVSNLNFKLQDEDLRNVFAGFGEVASAKVIRDNQSGRSRGFGFVEMDTETEEQSAIDALDGAEWMGRDLKVNKAKPRENRGSFGGNRRDSFSRSY